MQAYGDGDLAVFNQGMNTVNYALFDNAGPAAFRATAIVTADPVSAAVPLPAGGLLLLGALGSLALRRKRKA